VSAKEGATRRCIRIHYQKKRSALLQRRSDQWQRDEIKNSWPACDVQLFAGRSCETLASGQAYCQFRFWLKKKGGNRLGINLVGWFGWKIGYGRSDRLAGKLITFNSCYWNPLKVTQRKSSFLLIMILKTKLVMSIIMSKKSISPPNKKEIKISHLVWNIGHSRVKYWLSETSVLE